EQQMLRIGQISRMAPDLSLQDEDLAGRQQRTQMAVGAAVAEPEFEHRPRQLCNALGCVVQASALRVKPAAAAVETTHSHSLEQLPEDCRARSEGQPRFATT